MEDQFDPFELPPPNSRESEMELIGTMLQDREAICDAIGELDVLDFYYPAMQVVYQAIVELFEQSQPVDITTVSNTLKQAGLLDSVGGRTLINELATSAMCVATRYHIDVLRDLSLKRKYLESSIRIVTLCHNSPQGEIQSIANSVMQETFQRKSSTVTLVKDILPSVYEDIEKRYNARGKITGTPCGITKLDEAMGGLQKSDLIILAARPSMGKTALALQIAHYVSAEQPVLMFSLEMSKEQLGKRLLSLVSEVDGGVLRSGLLMDHHWSALSSGMSRLSDTSLVLDDSPTLTIGDILAKANQVKNHYPDLKLIVVDYIQLMSAPNRSFKDNNRVQEISAISRGLKNLARQLDVTVLGLSQLSRAVESREDKRPRLSDLRESGAIEQDADIVAFLYRDEYYNKDTERPGTADLIISKHRNGPLLTVQMYFRSGLTKFVEVA